MARRLILVGLFALAFLGHVAWAQDEDDDYDPAQDEDDHLHEGAGGEEEEGGGPAAGTKELFALEDFDEFVDNMDASIVGCFGEKMMLDPDAVKPEVWDEDEDGPWEGPQIENPAFTAFKSAASDAYNYRFAYSFDAALCETKKLKVGSLYLYRSPKFVSVADGERARERFPSGKINPEAVTKWAASKAQPLVGAYTDATKDRYSSSTTLVIFLNLDFDSNAKSVAYVLKRARKAAKALKGKVAIAVASIEDMKYQMESYGLETTHPKSDVLMGIKTAADSRHYVPPEGSPPFSAKALDAFVQAFLDGKLEEYVKPYSSPPAGTDDDDDMYNSDKTEEDYDDYGGEPLSGGEEDDTLKDEA